MDCDAFFPFAVLKCCPVPAAMHHGREQSGSGGFNLCEVGIKPPFHFLFMPCSCLCKACKCVCVYKFHSEQPNHPGIQFLTHIFIYKTDDWTVIPLRNPALFEKQLVYEKKRTKKKSHAFSAGCHFLKQKWAKNEEICLFFLKGHYGTVKVDADKNMYTWILEDPLWARIGIISVFLLDICVCKAVRSHDDPGLCKNTTKFLIMRGQEKKKSQA